jgi:hypothetical protein
MLRLPQLVVACSTLTSQTIAGKPLAALHLWRRWLSKAGHAKRDEQSMSFKPCCRRSRSSLRFEIAAAEFHSLWRFDSVWPRALWHHSEFHPVHWVLQCLVELMYSLQLCACD